MDLKALLKAEASRLGFALCGITSPDSPPSLYLFKSWITAGNHAGMNYLASDFSLKTRSDPRLLFPSVKSIIVLGMLYPDPLLKSPPNSSPPPPRIASYALQPDYHLTIPEKANALVEFLETLVNKEIEAKIFTDSSPILERDLAVRAGLGWIGKNGCLIHPRLGSYFLIAEIFIDIEIELDNPLTKDYCGTCRRCIEACPTGCILPDRTLEAGKCISYLTIENKGEIPADLRSKVGSWVFGCDICQQVCPWNVRFAKSTDASIPPEFSDSLKMMDFSLTSREFNLKYKNFAVNRARRKGFLRNLCVVMGNSQDPNCIPLLEIALSDNEPLVRAHAAWALGQISSQAALNVLRTAGSHESDPQVLAEITTAIHQIESGKPGR